MGSGSSKAWERNRVDVHHESRQESMTWPIFDEHAHSDVLSAPPNVLPGFTVRSQETGVRRVVSGWHFFPVFPVDPRMPSGVQPWIDSHTNVVRKLIFMKNAAKYYFKREQLLFIGWVRHKKGKKLKPTIAVVTAYGQLILIRKRRFRPGFHIVCSPNVTNLKKINVERVGTDVNLILEFMSEDDGAGGMLDACVIEFQASMTQTKRMLSALRKPIHIVKIGLPSGEVYDLSAPEEALAPLRMPRVPADGGLFAAFLVRRQAAGMNGAKGSVEMLRAVDSTVLSGLPWLHLDLGSVPNTEWSLMFRALGPNRVFRRLTVDCQSRTGPLPRSLFDMLHRNQHLVRIEFRNASALQMRDFSTNCSALNPNTFLSEVDFAGSVMETGAANAVAMTLSSTLKCLVSLNVSGCNLAPEGLLSLLHACTAHGYTMQHLDISNNPQCSICGEVANALVNFICSAPNLRTLSIGGLAGDVDSVFSRVHEHWGVMGPIPPLKSFRCDFAAAADGISVVRCLLKVRRTLESVSLRGFFTKLAIEPNRILEAVSYTFRTLVEDGYDGPPLSIDVSENPIVHGLPALLTSNWVPSTLVLDGQLAPPYLLKELFLSLAQNKKTVKTLSLCNCLHDDDGNGVQRMDQAVTSWAETLFSSKYQFGTFNPLSVSSYISNLGAQGSPAATARADCVDAFAHMLAFNQSLEELNISAKGCQGRMRTFGPMLAIGLEGLAFNRTLKVLDVSMQEMGPAAGIVLGGALRKNRSLETLRFDGNYANLEALQALRGCLYGNKKISGLELPHGDIQRHMDQLTQELNEAYSRERRARVLMKMAHRGGVVDWSMKNRAREGIREAKRAQGRVNRTRFKIGNLLEVFKQSIRRNKDVQSQKQSAREEKAVEREQLKTMKKQDLLKKKKSAVSARAWKLRHKALTVFVKACTALQKRGTTLPVFADWLQQRRRRSSSSGKFLSQEEFTSLWNRMGDAERLYLADCKERLDALFANESALRDKAEELQQTDSDTKLAAMDVVQRQRALERGRGVASQVQLLVPPDCVFLPHYASPSAPPLEEVSQKDALKQSDDVHRYLEVQTREYDRWKETESRKDGAEKRNPRTGFGSKFVSSVGNARRAAAAMRKSPDAVTRKRRHRYYGGYGAGYMDWWWWYFAFGGMYGGDHRHDDDYWDRSDDAISEVSDGGDADGEAPCDDADVVADGDHGEEKECEVEGEENEEGDNDVQEGEEDVYADGDDDDLGDVEDAGDEMDDGAAFDEDFADDGDYEDDLFDNPDDVFDEGELDDIDFDAVDDTADDMEMYAGAEPPEFKDRRDRCGDAVQSGRRRVRPVGDVWSPVAESCPEELPSWRELQARAFAEAIVSSTPLPYHVAKDVFTTKHRAPERDMTVVTQCSMDRLENLERLAMSWAGYLVVCVYIPADMNTENAMGSLKDMFDRIESCGRRMQISVLHGLTCSPANSPSPQYDLLYPVNALRNVALSMASTDLIFLLDVDFVPCNGLFEYVCSSPVRYAGIKSAALAKTAVVVPAFEHHTSGGGAAMDCPGDKASLIHMWASGKCSPFHMSHFPAGHRKSDYEHWARAQHPYVVEYEEYYEPYVIVHRDVCPEYDERFRGYGLNKCSHLYTMSTEGFELLVSPHHYVLAPEHEKSTSWKAAFGPDRVVEFSVLISMLYVEFKREHAAKQMGEMQSIVVAEGTSGKSAASPLSCSLMVLSHLLGSESRFSCA